jgi:hypothetical protein
MDSQAKQLQLELRMDGGQLAGLVRDCAGVERPFWGRLGLLAVLDALVTTTSRKE